MSTNDHDISWEDATAMTRRYRENSPPGSRIGVAMNKEAVKALLEQPGCAGIRFYFALTEDFLPDLVLVGMDGNGNDLTGITNFCANHGKGCPEYCSTPNPLNS